MALTVESLRAQFYANLYGIPVPKGQPDPDIYITLEALGSAGADKLGLYCNPSWGQYADVNANYPQPGYAVWQSGAPAALCTKHGRRTSMLWYFLDSICVITFEASLFNSFGGFLRWTL